jgi:hypothetical protein
MIHFATNFTNYLNFNDFRFEFDLVAGFPVILDKADPPYYANKLFPTCR